MRGAPSKSRSSARRSSIPPSRAASSPSASTSTISSSSRSTQVAKLADFSGKRVRVLAAEGEQTSRWSRSAPPPGAHGAAEGRRSTAPVVGHSWRFATTRPPTCSTGLWALMPVALVSKMSGASAACRPICRRSWSRPAARSSPTCTSGRSSASPTTARRGRRRQGRQALRRRAGGGDETRLSRGAGGARQEPVVEGALRQLKAAASS